MTKDQDYKTKEYTRKASIKYYAAKKEKKLMERNQEVNGS